MGLTVRSSISGGVSRLLGSKRRPEKFLGLMGVWGSFPGGKAGREGQLSHLNPVTLRLSGVVPPLPPFACVARIDIQCEQKERNVESRIM